MKIYICIGYMPQHTPKYGGYLIYAATYPKIRGLPYPLLTILNLTTGIIIFDILSPRAFRKYITPMVFLEFFKNPTYPKIWGLSYPFLKKNLKKFREKSNRSFRRNTCLQIQSVFLPSALYPPPAH